MREIIIDATSAGQRLDKFCLRNLGNPPKAFVQKSLRKKNITVNGKKAEGAHMLAIGDVVRIFISEATIEQFAAPAKTYPKGEIDIIFEDANILIANKPPGLLTQPNDESGDSLLGRVINYRLLHNDDKTQFQAVCINRLDRNVSGVVIFALTLKSAQELSELMRNRQIEKLYLGVCEGEVLKEMTLTGKISKDTDSNTSWVSEKGFGKEVKTTITPLSHQNGTTMLKINLHTGRSHQIRAHLQSIDKPLVGDKKYGGKPGARPLLHAWQVTINGNIYTASLPDDIEGYFDMQVVR